MANSLCEVLVTEGRLEAPEKNFDRQAGAIVDFWGVVRPFENEREIDGIEYEAHPTMAEHQLRLITQDAAEKFSLKNVIVRHRVGFVGVGEASLFLRVEAGHRGDAFLASEWIVDQLKQRVPIWKKPLFARPTCHPERSAAESKDPAKVSLKLTPRGPSAALGMTKALR
jgi:molybdopterin synthase catalytic subunit